MQHAHHDDRTSSQTPANAGGTKGVNSRTYVIVPAYNEADRLEQTLLPVLGLGYSVVLVDDGSTDRTGAVACQMPVHVLRHPINLGQGAALQTGTEFATARGAEWVVHFDADGQHQAADIARLIEPLRNGRADVVLGSRFLRAEDLEQVPRARRLLLRAAVVVNGVLTGLWLSDAHNGLRAFTADAAKQIRLRENRFAHATEILAQIRRMRLRYTEQPTTIRYTASAMRRGQSPWNAVSILLDVLIRKVIR
jgi:glycosyltransferase involved in cell wall biosynthesis